MTGTGQPGRDTSPEALAAEYRRRILAGINHPAPVGGQAPAGVPGALVTPQGAALVIGLQVQVPFAQVIGQRDVAGAPVIADEVLFMFQADLGKELERRGALRR